MDSPFRPSTVPVLGAPVRVLGTTVLVVVQCLQCDGGEQLALVNDQKAYCPTCGAVVSLHGVKWHGDGRPPKIDLTASRPSVQVVQ